MNAGGVAPAVFNAANEVAVEAFLGGPDSISCDSRASSAKLSTGQPTSNPPTSPVSLGWTRRPGGVPKGMSHA